MYSRQEFSNFIMHQNHPEGLLRYRFLGPILRVSESEGPEMQLRICISSKLPCDADADAPGTPLQEPVPNHWLMHNMESVAKYIHY